MAQAIERRYTRLKKGEGKMPDILLIDGGKGQLSQAVAIMNELGIQDVPVVGLAKARTERDFRKTEVAASSERVFIPGRKNPIALFPTSPAFKLLTHVRDEAHRFAIGTHRTRRAADMTRSALDEVPGIGAGRKRALLNHFGSARAVAVATLDDIKTVPGISNALAQKIHDHFRGGR